MVLQDVFFVLTDSDHKSGFKSQANLLAKMFWLVDSDKLQGPIYTAGAAAQGTSNREFLKDFVGRLLTGAFPNLSAAQITNFIDGLLATTTDQNNMYKSRSNLLRSLLKG